MAATPESFDYFRAGEPPTGLPGKVDNLGLDYFRSGEPYASVTPVTVTPAAKGKVIVGGVKKTVANRWVIVGGVKKSVVGASVIVGGVKKPTV